MYRGLLVVNAFLRTGKFDELYTFLAQAAQKEGMQLDVQTNAELVCALEVDFDPQCYDFVVFWDKDVLLAQQLEMLGMRLFNPARGIALCDDKSRTWLALKDTGIPMPRTVPAPMTFPAIGYPALDFAMQIGEKLGYPVVVKECCGSFGQQVYLCHDQQQLPDKVLSQIFIDFLSDCPVRLLLLHGCLLVNVVLKMFYGLIKCPLFTGDSGFYYFVVQHLVICHGLLPPM